VRINLGYLAGLSGFMFLVIIHFGELVIRTDDLSWVQSLFVDSVFLLARLSVNLFIVFVYLVTLVLNSDTYSEIATRIKNLQENSTKKAPIGSSVKNVPLSYFIADQLYVALLPPVTRFCFYLSLLSLSAQPSTNFFFVPFIFFLNYLSVPRSKRFIPMFSRRALPAFVLSLALVVLADPVPTVPDPGHIYNEGSPCQIGWTPDTTGEWKSMNIQLMTGNNVQMVPLTTVGTVDGTTEPGTFSYPCPKVTIHAAIYFYQFSHAANASDLLWTGRFAIADATGTTVPAPNLTQPDGEGIPWGVGALASNSTSSSSVSSSSVVPSSSVAALPGGATTASSSGSPSAASSAGNAVASNASSNGAVMLGAVSARAAQAGVALAVIAGAFTFMV